jgi:hypothetical protein
MYSGKIAVPPGGGGIVIINKYTMNVTFLPMRHKKVLPFLQRLHIYLTCISHQLTGGQLDLFERACN